ncbi:hypothetical protein EZV62_010605 [Acer yangbiense]|uniref:Ubiquitin-like protease family profile domain-containing protein n=1 Tax=Acer yangbiense TaxID=1000413 RepID=A0A5C7I2Y4_9ROSI|nr:hypothetical protein EZV62_010605 [Acer yangbiense]
MNEGASLSGSTNGLFAASILKTVKIVNYEKKNGGSDKTTSTTNFSKPKIGKRSRSEIGNIWRLLSIDEKAKFGQPDVVEVVARNMTGDQPHHRDNDIPNNSDLPPTDEDLPSIKNHPGHEDQTINTRCTPSQWCRIVKKLFEEQKEVVRAFRFGNLLALNCGHLRLKICQWLTDNFDTKTCSIDIHGRRFMINSSIFVRVLGISDQGDQISIYRDVPNIDYWKSKFAMTSRGIFLKDIEHCLEEMTTADNDFKVTLCLFLLGTIFCPSATDYVQTGYLIPLRDVGSIDTKNWSSWCFSSFCEGIEKFQMNRQRMKTCCISGCVLFLQLFYLHSLQWEPSIMDKAVIPVVCWTDVKIRKCVIRLHTEGGVGSNQVYILFRLRIFFKQPTPSEGQYDATAHGQTCHANQGPVTGNNAQMKGIADVLHVVKEIQATLKTELYDIRTNVNLLYAKFSSAEDKNLDKDLHKTSNHQNSMHNMPQNPPLPPPPPSSQPLSIPTRQHPIVDVSSNNTRPLSKHQQTISKSTPSWMKAHIEPPLQDGNAPDLPMEDQRTDDHYYVPPVLTIPSLLDEDEQESQSSNKRRFIKTRSTSKQKPSRYQISPYIVVPVNASTKYRYGPFRIGIQLNIYDEQLITYIFAKDLPSFLQNCKEVIIDLGHLQVKRKSFRTLEPYKFVDSEIINLITEYKTMILKSKRSQLSWFLPTNYGKQYSLKNSLSRLWESYMYDLHKCEKMQSLDIVLADDIVVAFPTTFSFKKFTISDAKPPSQPNGYDCGLLLCMFMDDNYPTSLQMESFQSQCQRLLLARFLALFLGNSNILSLKKNAQEHYNKLVSNNEVMPPVNIRAPHIQKLRGKAAALME